MLVFCSFTYWWPVWVTCIPQHSHALWYKAPSQLLTWLCQVKHLLTQVHLQACFRSCISTSNRHSAYRFTYTTLSYMKHTFISYYQYTEIGVSFLYRTNDKSIKIKCILYLKTFIFLLIKYVYLKDYYNKWNLKSLSSNEVSI